MRRFLALLRSAALRLFRPDLLDLGAVFGVELSAFGLSNGHLAWVQVPSVTVLGPDVIDGIAATMNGEYPQKHAVHVRPVGDRFQLTSGHHRKRAAEKRGFTSIWAWVEPLDDEAAFMELATSNNQGELAPLEIGIHALAAVPASKGGRGKKGGISAYAEKIGKTHQYVTQVRGAAEVYTSLDKTCKSTCNFLDKAQHLSSIHSADRLVWPECVAAMLAGKWSAADTEAVVHWLAARPRQFNSAALPSAP